MPSYNRRKRILSGNILFLNTLRPKKNSSTSNSRR